MAPEPWNRTHIPRPAIQCQLSVPLGGTTEPCMTSLIDKCSAVLTFLKSEKLKAEVATLDAMLYVYHHKLGYHKPYRALKQVQQCTKRIKSMGLENSLEEMMDLCPKKAELDGTQYCTVPSQPILELVSMKILGSCKLLIRLMDCCCKAFHLCLQHLHLEEFIVINIVLLGLLSRLWVMYRGLLQHLITLYSAHISMQKEVSDFQKMPYFKDFVFPTNIEDHIGSVSALVTKKIQNMLSKKSKTQFLSKVFDTSNLVKEEMMSKIRDVNVNVKETKWTLDVGQPVQMQRFTRDKPDTFDVKALFLPVKGSRLQALGSKKKLKESKKHDLSQHSRKKECVRHLVPKIQAVKDFQALSKQLLYAVRWCKERRLKTEAVFFRNRSLRCRRLQYAEALGYSLKKKLRFWIKSMCHSLCEQTLRKHHLKGCLRVQRFHQTWKHVVPRSQRHRRVKRKDFKRPPLCLNLFPDRVQSSVAASMPKTSELQQSNTKGTDRCLTDDIDDIFLSIGI